MVKKLKKVTENPGVFRTGFSKREYEMLAIALRRHIQRFKYSPNSKRVQHYRLLLQRIHHGHRRIDEQLNMYRKANGLVRCEYLEAEDEYKARI